MPASRPLGPESPSDEVWSRLRLFMVEQYASREIREVHHLAAHEEAANVRKQARQLGQCIQQGEDYFNAAPHAGLATRPLLLYYGTVHLTRAITLLTLTGDYSVDRLRSQEKHRHHGLTLKVTSAGLGLTSCTAAQFFGAIGCQCHVKRPVAQPNPLPPTVPTNGSVVSKPEPWGHFALAYRCLHGDFVVIEEEIKESAMAITIYERRVAQRGNPVPAIDSFLDKQLTADWLLRTCPDTYHVCNQLDMKPLLIPMEIRRMVVPAADPATGKVADETPVGVVTTGTIRARPDEHASVNDLLRNFPGMGTYEDGRNLGFHHHHKFASLEAFNAEDVPIPPLVADLSNRTYLLRNSADQLPELANSLACLFILGMFCRYYPDIWVPAISANTAVQEVTRTMLAAAQRKVPQLVLDHLARVKHYVT